MYSIFLFFLLFFSSDLFSYGGSVFDPRKEQTNIAQDFIFRGFDILGDEPQQTYDFTTAFSYHHSFKDSRISQALFGSSQLGISGSLIDERVEGEFLADQFGLSQYFKSLVTLKPVVTASKFLFLFSIYNPFAVRNTFLRMYLPLVVMTHAFGLSEEILTSDSETPFSPSYMSKTEAIPQHDFTEAIEDPKTFGTIEKLLFGKIARSKRLTGIADIRIEYGGAVFRTKDSQCLFYAIVAIPTGNKNKPEYMFYPFLGTHRQVECGLGISGHVVTNKNPISTVLLHMAVNLTTITKRKEDRSFDLKENGPLSRYLLVKNFDQFKNPTGIGKPLINVTTLSCYVHNKIQMDGLLACTIHHNRNVGIIGYNPFLKSRDIVTVLGKIPEITYGIKGIQNMFDEDVPTAITESTATIFGTTFNNQKEVADKVTQFVSDIDIDPTSAAMPFQLTHKIFAAWQWCVGPSKNNNFDCFLVLGTEIEFEGFNPSETIYPTKTTVNQWGLFGSVRVTF